MLPEHKKTLKSLVLELRHSLEGRYDEAGAWHAGDLEKRLNSLGVFLDREVPLFELGHLSASDAHAREVVDAYIALRESPGVSREQAVREYVRESAYTWANRLLALRMMEARGLIDEVVLTRPEYGNKSLEHYRAVQADPALRSQPDEGLSGVLETAFAVQAAHLPNLFDASSPATALRPGVPALKKAIALLSGTESPPGQQAATDEVFTAADALGWAYQYWNTEEKDRVFEAVRTKKAKIAGDDIIAATQLYTEPYMVKFLVQNSLGATWMCMRPGSKLSEGWEYYVKDADREPMEAKPARELTFLDPACGSGHFLLEAFDLLFDFYEEEGETDAHAIAASILERNLFGIDIDERAIQISEAALWMKAAEKAPDFSGLPANLLATNIRLPEERAGVDAYLAKHPEDAPLKPALETVLSSLAHADELGSLLKLEEPVEEELKDLERVFERSATRGVQTDLFGQTAIQGQLPTGVSSYEEWKTRVLSRLAEHFHEEAVSADPAAAWFGRGAAKGIKLFELLSRRYDVVAANPPYMGLRNLGPVLKRYLEMHYGAGKRELYSAFILRNVSLASNTGRLAMVTQQGWMFLSSFEQLRTGETGLLTTASVESLAQLGAGAFSEISGEVVSTVLLVVSRAAPAGVRRISAQRCVGIGSAAGVAAALRRGLKGRVSAAQAELAAIPGSPMVYWLEPRLIELLSGDMHLSAVADVRQGLATADNDRFLRLEWECAGSPAGRWAPYVKGGGYCKWHGLGLFRVDWQDSGVRIKSRIDPKTGNPFSNVWMLKATERDYFTRPGLTYTLMAGGCLGVRYLAVDEIFDVASISVFPFANQDTRQVVGVMNSRVASYLLRAMTQDLKFHAGYVLRLPFPRLGGSHVGLSSLSESAARLKLSVIAHDMLEREFRRTAIEHSEHAIQTHLLCSEACIEMLVTREFCLDSSSVDQVFSETGTPAGFHPLIAGYDALPPLPDDLAPPPQEVLDHLAGHERLEISDAELSDLRRRLKSLYEAGFGSKDADEETAPPSDEEEGAASGAYIPIPAETFIEELSQKLETHPISVYWLLEEGIANEGWRCIPEEQKELTDKVTVMVLRMLGHRWPKELEAGEPVAAHADPDGVVPITEGTDEHTLIDRLREVIPDELGLPASEFEAAFADAMGISVETWLATRFFAHHTKQFRKRPIAWQIASSKPTARRAPAFSALVYYHALDADLLPKVRAHYVGPLRARAEVELRGIDSIPAGSRSAAQASRRTELEERIAELKEFDDKLERIEASGFASTELDKLLEHEAIDSFCSIDGVKSRPSNREAFLAQEWAYLPDLNDGVRVNIAPWQKAGILASDVLAKKDLDKAVSDRARWRSDERRWCREGKLPRPGWWAQDGSEG